MHPVMTRLDGVTISASQRPAPTEVQAENVFRLRDVAVRYGDTPAVEDVTFDLAANEITAFIGPSGCGKSTLIRCLNRMNDLIPSAAVTGEVLYHGEDL